MVIFKGACNQVHIIFVQSLCCK